MQVVEAGDGVVDGGDDLRVGVTENGAHLSGGEVQDLPPVAVVHAGASGGGDDRLRELVGVSEQVFRFGCRHGIGSGCGAAIVAHRTIRVTATRGFRALSAAWLPRRVSRDTRAFGRAAPPRRLRLSINAR